MFTIFQLLLYWSSYPKITSASFIHPDRHDLRGRQAAAYLPLPSYDPFFTPPDNWRTYAPGEVMRVRPNAYPTINIKNCSSTFQVLFRSSDTHGNASWSSATVFMPTKHANCSADNIGACSHGIVSYLLPYDSADPDMFPSWGLQFGEPYGEMYDFLSRGWWVAAPDYEGPNASYTSGPQSGYATLDSVRAISKVAGDFGLRMDRAKYAVYGYSGGAMAAAFTAEMAAGYAPDLKLAAVVLGGTTPNLTTGAYLMNKKDTAGLVIASMVGITSQHPHVREFLVSRLKTEGPFNVTGFLNATTLSGIEALRQYAYHDVFDYFQNGMEDFNHPILQGLLYQDGQMGRQGIPNMPVFLYKATRDEMSPVNETDELVEKYCDGGANILYHRNDRGGHNQELWMGRPRALQYLSAMLDGTKEIEVPEKGCMTVNLTIPINITVVLGPEYNWDGTKVNATTTTTVASATATATMANLYDVGERV